VPSGPETQFRERTALARQRATLAFTLIAAMLLTHTHEWLAVSAALVVLAAGLRAHSPRELALATCLAAAAAMLVVVA
jgi:hypothetical protein